MTGPPESPRLLIAGRPGSGKTTAIARLVGLQRADGLAVNDVLYRVDDQHVAARGAGDSRGTARGVLRAGGPLPRAVAAQRSVPSSRTSWTPNAGRRRRHTARDRALVIVPQYRPCAARCHVAALTGTPLAPARRRRFTNMSEGPIMSTFGIVLMLVGAALAAAEAHVPSHGALGGAAAVAVAAGIALVVAGAGVGTAVALIVGLAAGMVAAGYAWIVVRKALAASRHRVRSGSEGLVGRVGAVRAAPAPVGQVFLDGALWRARVWAADEDAALQRGDPIVVERVDGLTLTVRRAEEWEVAP